MVHLLSEFASSSKPDLITELQNIDALWVVLKTSVPQQLTSAESSFAEHSQLIRQTRQFVSSILREFNMNYVQSPAAYNLTMSAFIHLPAVTDQIGKVRGLGAGLLSAKSASQLEKAELKAFMNNVESSLEDYATYIQVSVNIGASLPSVSRLLADGQRILQVSSTEILNKTTFDYDPGLFFDEATASIADFYDFNHLAIEQLSSLLTSNRDSLLFQQRLSSGVIVIVIVLALLTLYLISKSISMGVRTTVQTLNSLSSGNYGVGRGSARQDEFGEIAKTLNDVSLQLEDFSKRSLEAIRVKQALDNSSSCFMMADKDLNIIYMNEAVVNLLTSAEQDIKNDLPHFSASSLIGKNIDDFHRNPKHQRAILREIKDTYTAKIHLGNHTFRLIVNPIYNAQQTLIGHSVEWQDMTEYYEKEQRITRLLESLNCTSTNIMIVDTNAAIIYMNPSMEKMLKLGTRKFR